MKHARVAHVAAVVVACLAAASLASADVSRRSSAPPWIEAGIDLPSYAASVHVLRGDEPITTGPFEGAGRRGSAARDALLPLFGARRGKGCKGAWLAVGPLAWICSDVVEISADAPLAASARVPFASDGLPFRYYFVGPEGSNAYKNAEDVDVAEPAMNLEKGFAVAISGERSVDGQLMGRTQHDLWVPMRDLGAVHAFAFQGELLDGSTTDSIPIAWIVSERARVLSKPQASAVTQDSRLKFDVVKVLEESKSAWAGSFYRIGEGEWIKASDARRPTIQAPPEEVDVDAGERWIDVDLDTQTLLAFEGKKPVFATLVSTGKGRQGTELATPKGTHRVWIKLLSSDMDNLEDENASRYYRIENVPWVQYFSKGVGLHGAFWHRSFGHVRSHGCVNLSPLDAQRLFYFTSPHMPAGWTAAFPTGHERGTVIRVR